MFFVFSAASDVLIKLQKIAFLRKHAFLMSVQASLFQRGVDVAGKACVFNIIYFLHR